MGESMRLLAFFRGTGTDGAGRRLADVLAWDDEGLESHHDYIQWLFPLRTRSSVHPETPILDEAVIAEFHRDPELRRVLLSALDRMLSFYGLRRCTSPRGEPIIEPSSDFEERRRNWLWPNNHNHLRLTRILTCLRILGLQPYAAALQKCLMRLAGENPGSVTDTTLRFWQRSLTGE